MEKPTSTRYPPVLRERAVRMVMDLRAQDPHDKPVIPRVACQLGVGDESLRSWVKSLHQILDFDLNSFSGTDRYCRDSV
jgi:transposase-like protein